MEEKNAPIKDSSENEEMWKCLVRELKEEWENKKEGWGASV